MRQHTQPDTSSQSLGDRALGALLDRLQDDRALFEPAHLRARADALDRLEQLTAWSANQRLLARAGSIRDRLEAVDRKLCAALRAEILRGDVPACLRELLAASASDETPSGEHYDYRDALIGGLLQFELIDDAVAAPAAEMVFYQPTPARHIFDLIRRVAPGPDDVLVDLGAGLGHVPLLAAICTPARSVGIELEAVYVAGARRAAAALGISRTRFVQQDAREADLAEGTVFYLYTPFTGAVLREVLDALRRQAVRRDLRICTLARAQRCWRRSHGWRPRVRSNRRGLPCSVRATDQRTLTRSADQ